MDNRVAKTKISTLRRKLRVRKKLKGNAERPRLCINKSNKHLFVQLINDEEGKTILGLGTVGKEFKGSNLAKKSKDAAKHLGQLIAKKAQENKIDKIVFDRGSCKYHGVLAVFAEAAREAGLKF